MRRRAKEMHVYLDMLSVLTEMANGEIGEVCQSYKDTYTFLNKEHNDIIRTTITHFLSWDFGERLFVHVNNEVHEITLGECEGTDKDIRVAHNLEKLLFAGKFSWFDPTFSIREMPSKEDFINSMEKSEVNELSPLIKWSRPLYICPKCKEGYMREDCQSGIIIATYPPIHKNLYKCNKCGYEETLEF